jgi:NADH-quinone oxidoreductase subunit N
LYYTSAYALAGNRCLQCNYICLQRQWKRDMVNFHGLGTNPLLAAILTASLLSMAGIQFLQVSLLNYFYSTICYKQVLLL